MSRLALLVVGALVAPLVAPRVARADDADVIDRVRGLLGEGKLAEARDLLRDAYAETPRPELLFALGQVEFNLGNFSGAIDYYERFLDTNPAPDQIALAQQAIGAARARLAQPVRIVETSRPVPRFERDWDGWSSAIVALGGVAIATGGGVFAYGYYLGDQDPDESLTDYEARRARSRRWQWTGAGIAGGGALVIGIALVRYGVRRVEVMPMQATASGTVGLAVARSW